MSLFSSASRSSSEAQQIISVNLDAARQRLADAKNSAVQAGKDRAEDAKGFVSGKFGAAKSRALGKLADGGVWVTERQIALIAKLRAEAEAE